MNVEIKERPLTNGRKGLYLEYYEKGFRKRENLQLYLEPEEIKGAKARNRDTYKKALEIRADRIINPPSFEQKKETVVAEELKTLTWLQWIDRYIDYSVECGNCKKAIDHKKTVRKHIANFLKRKKKSKVLLKDVDTTLILALYDYMSNDYRNPGLIKEGGGKLADGTLVLFQEAVRAIFNKAIRDGLLTLNPVNELRREEKFRAPDSHREYLTAEELKMFLSAETINKQEWDIQHAFGFSSMTGLRLGDVRGLKWSNIIADRANPSVTVLQNKTQKPVSIPLNDVALSLLPERPTDGDDELVFHLPKKPDNVAKYIRRITARTEIQKDFTYHTSRHTTATLAITAGAELYSVSKILGHSSIKSTQVYAKVDLATKIETVNLVNGIFG